MASAPSKGPKSSKTPARGPQPPARPPMKGGKAGGQFSSKAAANVAAKRAQRVAPAPVPPAPAVTFGMSTAEKIAWYSLQVLIFLVPLAMSNANWLSKAGLSAFALPFTYDQFDIVKVFVMRACAIVAMGAWSFRFFFKGGTLRRTKLDWLILAFLAWVLLTSFTSISISTALFGKYRRFEGFFSFVTYAVVYFLVVQLADRPGRMRSLAKTLLISGMIVSFYGALQSIGADPVSWGSNLPFEANRSFATYGNPDLLGGFLIFPLAISVAMALSEHKVGWRIFYWATFLVTVWTWIAAAVRGAWIGGAVALLVVIVAAVLAKAKLHVVDWSFAGITGVAAAALVARSMTMPGTVFNVPERIASIFKFGEGSALTRFEIWQSAIEAIKARPLFGFGADTFRLVFPKYKPVAYVKDAGYLSVADNVHDYPLQLMAGIGVIGFLLLYGIFGWALWLGAPNAFARGKGTDRLFIAGFWAAAVGYIIHLFFGLSVTGSTVFLWIALAIIVTPTAREVEVKAPAWGPIVSIALLAVLGVAWIGNAVFIVADNYFLRGQLAQTGDDPVQLIGTAIRLNPYNDIYKAMLGKAYESQMIAWLNQASTDSGAGKDPSASLGNAKTAFTNAETTFKQTIAMVPTEYDNYLFISSLYNEGAAYFQDASYTPIAIEWADKGIAVEPFGPGVRLQKAVAQAAGGDDAGAIATLEAVVAKRPDGTDITVVDMDPNFSDIHMFYGQVLQRTGQLDKAAAVYRQLVALNPGNTTYSDALSAVEASLSAVPSTTP